MYHIVHFRIARLRTGINLCLVTGMEHTIFQQRQYR